jgi:hypothetical protein
MCSSNKGKALFLRLRARPLFLEYTFLVCLFMLCWAVCLNKELLHVQMIQITVSIVVVNFWILSYARLFLSSYYCMYEKYVNPPSESWRDRFGNYQGHGRRIP